MKNLILSTILLFILSCNSGLNNELNPSGNKDEKNNPSKSRFSITNPSIEDNPNIVNANTVNNIYEISENYYKNSSEKTYIQSLNNLNSLLAIDLSPDYSSIQKLNNFFIGKLKDNPRSLLENLDIKYINLANQLMACFNSEYNNTAEIEKDLSKAIQILKDSDTSKEFKFILEIRLRKLIYDAEESFSKHTKGAKITSTKPKCKLKDLPCQVLYYTHLSAAVLGWYLVFNTQPLQDLINQHGWDYIVQCCFCQCQCSAGCPSLIGHAY